MEFEKQYHTVMPYMLGKEKHLLYFRITVLALLSFEVIIDFIDGYHGQTYKVSDLTKWALWITTFNFSLGLFYRT